MSKNARLSLWVSMLVVGIAAFWGAWTRRWISDDGLIVLRTVRNILAGNGPVFNVGERVEANTSTLWQYLIALGAWISGARLEYVALTLSLVFTTAACVIACWAAGNMWKTTVVPFGIMIYLALPPARDFATSGLEWGLSILWLAVWWALLVEWSSSSHKRHAMPQVGYGLALWCGLSWLVRPELALYGGVTGIVLLCFSPRQWWKILLAALPIPAAYQIFRMGYYGLLTPQTAVAKSAADSAWNQGFDYLADFVGPYALWLPVIVAIALIVWLMRDAHGRRRTIVLLVVACAIVHVIYVLRVGGDFMHARMLLLPLFALLLPVAAIPLSRTTGVATVVVAVWAAVVVVKAHYEEPTDYSKVEINIVNERDFWTWGTEDGSGRSPLVAEDFLRWTAMRNWQENLKAAKAADAGATDMSFTPAQPGTDATYTWYFHPRDTTQSDLSNQPLSVYWINLGMTSMNADLDTRVLDTVGLATPLAARMPRVPDGRIGHDRQLPPWWQFADTDTDVASLSDNQREKVMQARAALRTPKIRELLASYREPMSFTRFMSNIEFSLTDGRTLQIDSDPAKYLDKATLDRIRQGEDVGRQGPKIAWPDTP